VSRLNGRYDDQDAMWFSHHDGNDLQVVGINDQDSAQSNLLPMQLMIGSPVMLTIENQKAKMRYLAKNPDAPFKEGGVLSAINFMVGQEIEIITTSNGLKI
jgi:hypothetical protein